MYDRQAGTVDWEHWKRLDRWELREAISLMVGVNPDSWLGSQIGRQDRLSNASDLQRERHEASKRIWKYAWASHSAGSLRMSVSEWGPATLAPLDWLRWAKGKGLTMPPELETMLPSDGEQLIVTKPAVPNEKPLLTRERETALKLIIGMAIDGYGFDPNAARSPVPTEIADALDELGLSLDVDTVRKWLHEAAALSPKKAQKN